MAPNLRELLSPRLWRPAAHALDALGRFVLPAWCLSCEAPLGWPTPPLCLCAECGEGLSTPAPSPAVVGLHGLWSYEPPAAQVVRGLKYEGLQFLASDIADAMVQEIGDDLASAHAVCEVPLHWRRRLRRGYDQAELIAGALADRLGVAHRHLLRRTRATAPQTSLGRTQRVRNLEGAFKGRRPLRRRRLEHVVLIDDVATTGATLRAAAAELTRQGVKRITPVVAAITPSPGNHEPAHPVQPYEH